MNDFERKYSQNYHNSRRIEWLASTEGAVGVGITSDIVGDIAEKKYLNWNTEFVDRIEDIKSSGILASIPDDIKEARRIGVSHAWKWDQFLASPENNAPRELFYYYDDSGNRTKFSNDQMRMLQENGKVSFEGKTLEGHHINSVSCDPSNLDEAANPENIIWATSRKGHLNLHNGSWNNPTSGETNDIYEKIEKIENHKEYLGDLKAYFVTGLLFGSIFAIIKLRELSKSKKPWDKKFLLFTGSLAYGTTLYGGIAAISERSGDLLSSNTSSYFFDNLLLMDNIDINSQVFESLLDSAITIEIAVILRIGIKAITKYYQGNSIKEFFPEMGKAVLIITAESTGFILAGIVLDSWPDIPDPYIYPIIISLRIAYSIWKVVVNYKISILQEKCLEKRHDTIYEMAVLALA
ncbi:hypothetical protein ACFL5P_01145 [candidate division KSB1 bacterium]